jgi:hypothetical protein
MDLFSLFNVSRALAIHGRNQLYHLITEWHSLTVLPDTSKPSGWIPEETGKVFVDWRPSK